MQGAEPIDVKGFLETSFVDWPGKVASVVFLPRCNYRCPYCHNHRLVTDPESYVSWPLDNVLQRLSSLRDWVDGVCVTGGEPTLHGGLAEMLRRLRREHWRIKLDTNGSRPRVIRELVEEGLLDAVSLDVKAPLEPIPYRRNGGEGANPAPVRETLDILADAGLPVEVRTTVHPRLLSREEVLRLVEQVGGVLGGAMSFKLQRCRTEETLDRALADTEPLDQETFDAWSAEAASLAREITGRGGRPAA